MDERLQFVARRLAGEAMAELCREFGISRKTGYKIFDRYQECGIQGLTDRSRRPYRYAHQLRGWQAINDLPSGCRIWLHLNGSASHLATIQSAVKNPLSQILAVS